MGHRANLLLVEHHTYSLYYSHWGGISMPENLFWGPEAALEFIKRQEPTTAWLDTAWAEGGALMDLDRQVLLWYGGEDVNYEIPLRRHLIRMMKPLWPGWSIEWASAGILDLAEYVGHPTDELTGRTNKPVEPAALARESAEGWVRTIASIVFSNGELRLYPAQWEMEEYLLQGPELLEHLDQHVGRTELDLKEWPEEIPDQGFHLDIPARTIHLWYAPDLGEVIREVREIWSGWHVVDLKDQFEEHVSLVHGKLCFVNEEPEKLTERLRRSLLRNYTSPVNTMMEIAQQQEAAGKKIEVNPLALKDIPLEITQAKKAQLLQYVIARLGDV